MNLLVSLVFFSLVVIVPGADDILCTSSFCDNWLLYNTCTDVPDNCLIQNDTHNGIVLPFAGPCHCCDYCVINLVQGDSCSIGTAASPLPRVICGDLLSCKEGTDDNTCEPIETDCTSDQVEYDRQRTNGTLGHLQLRANCQRRGLYKPFKCIPGEICYCVNDEGERIFGDMPYTPIASSLMNCECSRNHQKASRYLGTELFSTQFLRCKTNGDYDPIQCVDDSCFCVHVEDGTLAVDPGNIVNITNISNETLSCFDNDTHIEGEYYRNCEARVAEILREIDEFKAIDMEIIGYHFPKCGLDGYYALIQENSTHKFCSDRHGNVLEDIFIVNITDPLAENMDCNCARSRNITVADKPDCCANGNYNPVQCRRGFCRCVDPNGIQTAQEVSFLEKELLYCYADRCNKEEGEVGTTTVKYDL